MNRNDRWSEQMGFYRFFSNERVKESELLSCAFSHCVDQCCDMNHLLLLEDTTELNLEKHRHRITDKTGLGLTGNNKNLGFFCHPTLAVNPLDASLIGVVDAHIWHRDEAKQTQPKRTYPAVSIEEKESYRWADRAIIARQRLQSVERVTVVQDREGDIYESFHLLQESGVDFVIRSNHDRKLAQSKLRELIGNLPVVGEYELMITGDSKKRRKRKAIMEIRYAEVELCRPASIACPEKYPDTLTVRVVQVRENPDSVPVGEKPVEWTLYTSHKVQTETDALQIVYWYTLRWLIEDFFRTLKSEGLNYEESELETGAALRKLLVMALMAAIQILQLRQARDGSTLQKPSLIFSNDQLLCMEDLLVRFEGKTEKQKNPHSRNNLAWATWMIARLGGWKGFASQRPPGVIILRMGLQRFHAIYEGWRIAKDVYKR
jgi:hypothetical protein